uniref:Uncharacterized protein n=1 Tax=Arundo donax TaxID=35708 RepID=A0A0A9E827_ARUDO
MGPCLFQENSDFSVGSSLKSGKVLPVGLNNTTTGSIFIN